MIINYLVNNMKYYNPTNEVQLRFIQSYDY